MAFLAKKSFFTKKFLTLLNSIKERWRNPINFQIGQIRVQSPVDEPSLAVVLLSAKLSQRCPKLVQRDRATATSKLLFHKWDTLILISSNMKIRYQTLIKIRLTDRTLSGKSKTFILRRFPMKRILFLLLAVAFIWTTSLVLNSRAYGAAPRIDVVFLLDTTGSMGDEIEVIKVKIKEMISKIALGDPPPDVRFGIVIYRDRGDDYVTQKFAITGNIDQIVENLQKVEANGGGDYPESVNEALHVTLNDVNWDLSSTTSRLVFLIADAPPHLDYPDDYNYKDEMKIALTKEIVIHAIGASGLDSLGVAIFTEIAEGTEGTFQFLTYQKEIIDASGDTVIVKVKGGEAYYTKGDSTWKAEGGAAGTEVLYASESGARTDAAGGSAGGGENNLDSLITEAIRKEAEHKGTVYDGTTTDVKDEGIVVLIKPDVFHLGANFPNPFNPSTTIPFELSNTSSTDKIASTVDFKLSVYNVIGREVKTLASGNYPPGSYTITWNGRDKNGRELPSGIYFYKLEVGKGAIFETRKMVLGQ